MKVISLWHTFLVKIKNELDDRLNANLLEKINKKLEEVNIEKMKHKEFDSQTEKIIERINNDNIIGCLKEIFEWYAPHANVSFSYLSGIVPKWGYTGDARKIALRMFPDEKDKKKFIFYVVLNKRWFRAGFKKHYWVSIAMHYDKYRKSLAYTLHTTDRSLVTRWERELGDDKNSPLVYFPLDLNQFYDKSSLLEFIKTGLIHKMTSPSLKKIDYWDTYHFEKTGLS